MATPAKNEEKQLCPTCKTKMKFKKNGDFEFWDCPKCGYIEETVESMKIGRDIKRDCYGRVAQRLEPLG